MPSFRIALRPNRRAAARFVLHVLRMIQKAYVEEHAKTGISQSDIGRDLEVHRSLISRELHGRRDISVGRIAEYAFALGREIVFDLPKKGTKRADNRPENPGFVIEKNDIEFSSSSSRLNPPDLNRWTV